MNIIKLKRRLVRMEGRRDRMKDSHEGHEQDYTYHAGWDMGYVVGIITEIENTLDELEGSK